METFDLKFLLHSITIYYMCVYLYEFTCLNMHNIKYIYMFVIDLLNQQLNEFEDWSSILL